MKKLFAIAFITLLFCSSLFAEDFVVTKIEGKANYQTSDGIWEKLNVGDKITSETVISVKLDSYVYIKNENEKVYCIGITTSTVGKRIEFINNHRSSSPKRNTKDEFVEVKITPDHIDKSNFNTLQKFGFDSIKELPAGKNVVRLLAVSWGHEVIELTWTESSASVAHFKESNHHMNEFDWDEDPYTKGITERKIDIKNAQKILNLIKKIDFYNQPGYVYRPAYGIRDGESWYVEANINGVYKSVERVDPDPRETFLKDLGDALYRLAR